MGLGAGAAAIAAAAIGAGGGIAGGMLGASGSEKAAQTSADTQMNIFDKTQQNLAPFISMGGNAMTQLGGLLGFGPGGLNKNAGANAMSFIQNQPGYQFQFGQGVQAVDRSAAARGLDLSGGQLKDLTQFGQGTAQSAWNSYIGQLQQSAGLGENAAAGTAYSNAITGANIGGAQAQGINNATSYEVGGLQSGLQNSLLAYSLANQGGNNFNYGGAGMNTGGFMGNYVSNDYSSAYPSDVRLKKDIRRVGTTNEGLGVYLYRFKAGGPTQMGVMAQEVERSRPGAVITLPSGFKAVRYDRLSTPLSRYAPHDLKEAA